MDLHQKIIGCCDRPKSAGLLKIVIPPVGSLGKCQLYITEKNWKGRGNYFYPKRIKVFPAGKLPEKISTKYCKAPLAEFVTSGTMVVEGVKRALKLFYNADFN